MKPRRWDTLLYDLAEGQLGYFTTAQAREAGLHPIRLVQLHRHGDIERVSRGVYRLTRYPVSPLGEYMEATLWPQVRRPGARATVSHESALAIYGLSNVSPVKVHLTLPYALRIRRAVPRHLMRTTRISNRETSSKSKAYLSRRPRAPSETCTRRISDLCSSTRQSRTDARQAI